MCTLTVYAPNDHVDHYGYAKTVNVVSVNSSNSYHEYGTTSELVVAKGKVVVEETGVVFGLNQSNFIPNGSGNYIATTATSGNGIVLADTTPAISNDGGNVMASSVNTVKASSTFEINSLSQLEAFRDATNSGKTFKGTTVNLNCDISLKEAWNPISNYYRKDKNNNNEAKNENYGDFNLSDVAFQGIFNGNEHTITGLTNIGLEATDYNTGYNNSTPQGKTEVVYGFFATVYNATIKNLKFANVKITNEAYGELLGDSIGACVGYSRGTNTNISGITVLSGSLIEGFDATGGIIGRDESSELNVTSCENNATIFANEGACGITGRTLGNLEIATYTSCTNNGNITSNYGTTLPDQNTCDKLYACGITSIRNVTKITLDDCKNTGAIKYNKDNKYSTSEYHSNKLLGTSGKEYTSNNIVKENCKAEGSISTID